MREFLPPQEAIVEEDPNLCPECHGRGWKITSDGGAGTATRCDCQKRERGREYLALAGIPERYAKCRLSKFQTDNENPKVRDALVDALGVSRLYVDNFFDARKDRPRESGLIYVGIPGTGKTHLATAVLHELISIYKVRGRFADFTALIHQIQSTFDPASAESKHQVLDPIMNADVLVLDELGAQKPTEWVMNTLYLIINERYLRRLPTIFTTNYRLELQERPVPEAPPRRGANVSSDAFAAREQARRDVGAPPVEVQAKNPYAALATRISPQLLSRLYEMAQPVELPDFDFRRTVRMHGQRVQR